jgi:hypothetical protein
MLSLKIDGLWEPQDFIDVLQAVEGMYYKLALLRYDRRRVPIFDLFDLDLVDRIPVSDVSYSTWLALTNQRITERGRYSVQGRERLKVRRVAYASPGGIDLMGLGKVCEVIANSIGSMKRYWDDAHLRRERDSQATSETRRKHLEEEKERENIRSLQIKNARDALELLERYPDRQDVLIPLLVRDQETLSSRIVEGKLIGASVRATDESRRE